MSVISIIKYMARPFRRWIKPLQGWREPIDYWIPPPVSKLQIAHSIPIYCINLERAIERKAYIEKTWIANLGFDINFWKAQDQRDLSQQDYCVLTNPDKAINRLERVLTVGEVACALSHRLLYEYILKLGLEEVIVLEDDVAPHFVNRDYFFNYIQQGKIEFPKVDLFLLHDAPNPFKITSHKLYFSKLDNAPWGTRLVYYRRAGLEKMVLGLKEINSVLDDWNFYFPQKGSVAVANRPLGIHLNDTTYIGNEFRRDHRKFIS